MELVLLQGDSWPKQFGSSTFHSNESVADFEPRSCSTESGCGFVASFLPEQVFGGMELVLLQGRVSLLHCTLCRGPNKIYLYPLQCSGDALCINPRTEWSRKIHEVGHRGCGGRLLSCYETESTQRACVYFSR